MKIKTFLLVVTLFILSTTASAQEVPKMITQGLDAYKASGFSEAFSIWLKGSPLESDKTTMMNLKGAFTQIESMYGKATGYELFRTTEISQSTTRVYVEIRYEKGPLFVFFDCYKSSNGWIIPMMKFHTEADKILPEDLLKKK
jgi:hypothetical protein